ncbi:hypothetical protein [Helicobacter pylori]|uniref:hypothetical protein n=1 Tax=Helicobacter pylori TaxID=210 RepID=UPI001923DACE|nr:hypothetical protein [Helicobacter pylori]QQW62199.1 hypothetical protein HGI43_06230 [Helicobacter pylori]QQW63660.1 hypothetical protein HGI44_06400 [Helicobacter pylori]QQW68037.1 hypothetical protein HGK50_06275 [Helicobacter pylori]QQW95585.1 hypothetical protein HG559_06340 [Helicobacter pylori]QQW98465.1 hypothetical protein HG557_06285 [Helicobacter pylori]
MDTNKNKNASHLTQEMKKNHGGLQTANNRADEQPILTRVVKELETIVCAKDEIIDAQKIIIQAMEKEKQAVERLRTLERQLKDIPQLPNDNDTIDIDPEDEKD